MQKHFIFYAPLTFINRPVIFEIAPVTFVVALVSDAKRPVTFQLAPVTFVVALVSGAKCPVTFQLAPVAFVVTLVCYVQTAKGFLMIGSFY